MTPIKLLLALPVIAILTSCTTTRTEVWRPAPNADDQMLEQFVGAAPSAGFIAPTHDAVENPLTKDGKPVRIFLTSKFVDVSTKQFEKHDTFSDPQFQVKIRRLSQTKGADLMSSPSVVTRVGQRAKIEIIREMALKGEAFSELLNMGVAIEVKPAILKNGRIHLSGKATVREVDSPEVKFGDNLAISLQTTDTYFDTTLKDGQTALLICRDKDTVGQRIVFITARMIDPSGQPTKPVL